MNNIKIGQLTLKIIGFSYPKATNEYDADWLDVQVTCQTKYADINFSGVFLSATQLIQFGQDIDQLYKQNTDVAYFSPMEPSVIIELKKQGSLGAIVARIELEPCLGDVERYFFEFLLDQSYLPGIISQLKSIITPAKN